MRTLLSTPFVLSIFISALLAALAQSGCSSASSNTNASTDAILDDDQQLSDLLITARGSGPYSVWACVYESGKPSAFVFFDQGDVDGYEDLYLGMEISLTEDRSLNTYMWRATSQRSILMRSPQVGTEARWDDIQFNLNADPVPLMRAFTEAQGSIYCSLEGGQS